MKLHRTSVPAALAILAVVPLQAQAVRVDYAIDVGVEYNDNVLMARDPVDSSALRTGIGLVLSEQTSTVQANLGGRLDYWHYLDGPQSSAVEASLAGRVNWFITPEFLSFTVEDNLEMRPIDRFAPDSVDNRQRVNVFSMGPNLHFNWSEAFRGRFEMRWTDASAEEDDEFESQRLGAALHLLRELDPTSSITLSLRGQDVDFDHDLLARDYRRYDSYLRYQKELNRLGFGLDAGYTWVDYADGDSAALPMLRGQARWQLSDRSSLGLSASRQLSDSASAAIDGITEVVSIPDNLTGTAAGIESSVYKESRAELSYTYSGTRFGFSIGPYYERMEYLDADAIDETRRGAIAQASYRMARGWELQGFADVGRVRYPGSGLESDDTRAGIGVQKTWTRHLSSSLLYSHYRREDNGLFGDSRQNIWYLTLTYRNR